jgi:hypothetical protein
VKKSGYMMVLFLLMLVFVSSFVNLNMVQVTIAQDEPEVNPCPEGQFPETDSNGLIVHDPITGRAVCSVNSTSNSSLSG